MDFLTGLGFLGSYLQTKVKATHIPHDKISSVKLKPYNNFYFISAYGNLISHTNEKEIIQSNVLDLIHILEETDFNSLHSFVYVSSSSVKRRVQNFYSRTKRASEEILLAYAEKYNAPICIVRPLSITGVGEQEEHLIPTLIRSCLTGESMPFVPDAYHDFIDVEDVRDGILALSGKRARGIYELGTGISRSNDEVRLAVEKATGKKANIHIVNNMRSYDSKEWVSTNFRARQFGWRPQKPFEVTIDEMVKAYVKH